jgi:Zn-dependent M16 (insulinase) family peptidase
VYRSTGLEVLDFIFTIDIDDKDRTREVIDRIQNQLPKLINGGHVMTLSMSEGNSLLLFT